jgi:hypothetical protein
MLVLADLLEAAGTVPHRDAFRLLRAALLGLFYGGASPLPILKAAQPWFRNVIMLHFEILT